MNVHPLGYRKKDISLRYITHLAEPFEKKILEVVTRRQELAFVLMAVDYCQQNGVTVFSVPV
jgi:hypothetical protein